MARADRRNSKPRKKWLFAAMMSFFVLGRLYSLSDDRAAPPTAGDDAADLLVASHGALSVLGEQGSVHLLKGVLFYGLARGDDADTVWASARDGGSDFVLLVDIASSVIVEKYPIDSHFTHDLVRYDDTRLLIADTSSGRVLVWSTETRSTEFVIDIFTAGDHLNTLKVRRNTIYAILHRRKSPSALVAFTIDLAEKSYTIIQTYEDIGTACHGIEFLEDSRALVLSSGTSSLVAVDLEDGSVETLYVHPGGVFLKGLTLSPVDVARFTVSEYADAKGRFHSECALMEVDLRADKPHAVDQGIIGVGLVNTLLPRCSFFDDLERLRADKRLYGTPASLIEALPFDTFDIPAMRRDVTELERIFAWKSRDDVNNEYIPLISRRGNPFDESRVGPFAIVHGVSEAAPYLMRVMASIAPIVGRARLMKLRGRATVVRHKDATSQLDAFGTPSVSSGYWGRRHRVHIPIQTSPEIEFTVGSVSQHMRAGRAYVFDNSQPHSTHNPTRTDRIHLVFDTVASVSTFIRRSSHVRHRFVVENFADAPVFEAMKHPSRFLNEIRARYRLPGKTFKSFGYLALVEDALQETSCSADYAEAVESFARLISYECDTARGPSCY